MTSKKRKNIAIVDYGVGNLHSILKSLDRFGHNSFIAEDADKIKEADAVILPGVGAFKSGIEGLKVRGLFETVKNFANTGKPMLGICLGAQLMLSEGQEFGKLKGLGIIAGTVRRFPKLKEKVPHIGWNEIYSDQSSFATSYAKATGIKKASKNKQGWEGTILDSVKENSDVYFVHSYILQPDNKEDILCLSQYGKYEFCSAMRRNNIYGCQFHPEKSAQVGLKIIGNFIKLI